MVVVCESCSTRFQLDEARIPPKGTLVRCSRCKSTFIVRPPSVSFEATVQNVVAEVTQSDGAPVPEPAEDLFDTSGDDLGETRERAAPDEAWEFDEAPVRKPPNPTLGITGTPAHAPEPTAPPLEEIGSPEEWDLLGDSVSEAASAATFVEPERLPEPEPVPAPEPAPPAVAERAPEPVRRSAETSRAGPDGRLAGVARVAANAGRTLLHATAWLALAGAFSLGVARVAPHRPALVTSEAKGRLIPLPDGEARRVEVRFVENAFAGTLFVVQGELARSGFDTTLGLRVYWVDESGARLGEGEWAGPVPTGFSLRERAPEALSAEGAGAARPAPQRGAFAALFESVPAEATGVALALEPLPAPPSEASAGAPPEAAPGAPSENAAAAGEPPAAATASSPPSPRPSSE